MRRKGPKMQFRSQQKKRRLGLAFTAVLAGTALAVTGCSSKPAASKASSITIFNGATGTIAENFNPFSPTLLQPTLGIIYEPLYYYNLASTADPVEARL